MPLRIPHFPFQKPSKKIGTFLGFFAHVRAPARVIIIIIEKRNFLFSFSSVLFIIMHAREEGYC